MARKKRRTKKKAKAKAPRKKSKRQMGIDDGFRGREPRYPERSYVEGYREGLKLRRSLK